MEIIYRFCKYIAAFPIIKRKILVILRLKLKDKLQSSP